MHAHTGGQKTAQAATVGRTKNKEHFIDPSAKGKKRKGVEQRWIDIEVRKPPGRKV
ncbi:hypothetical protein Syun_005727 [Stephania yunnanensis]|uniref:Uncharacterized protein n=1 Tax=Stephania yunnanensis TaxID=152371 RepID=A0AAP0Q0N9_9MAGN